MKKKDKYIMLLIVFIMGSILHFKYIHEPPSHVHAWTQSDRYALSKGFVNNNLNFFKPETFVLNQSPDLKARIPHQSITAVDFPVHDYIPAVFMKISGNEAPFIFRMYILLYSFIGLFFLSRLSFLLTADVYKSAFVVIFTATSPLFVYYQSGFLPSIPSFSNVIIGMYFYVRYFQEGNQKNFAFALLFFTLAALARTTFAIPLIAVFGLELFRIFKGDSRFRSVIVPVVLSVSAVTGYLFYNHYLRTKYGGIFLNHALPARSFAEAREILKATFQNWGKQYFSKLHYLLLFGILVVTLVSRFRKKATSAGYIPQLWLLLLLLCIGCFGFALLMLRQFVQHDYYFLDTFFVPAILFLILIISRVPDFRFKFHKPVYIAAIFLVSIPLLRNASKTQQERRITGPWDITAMTIENFRGSGAFLDSLHISKKARILLLDAYAPNIPFEMMDRKGYAVFDHPTVEKFKKAMLLDYDYIVIQNDFFVSDVYSIYPEILSDMEKIADNGKISVCKFSKIPKEKSLIAFMGLENKVPVFQKKMTFDETTLEPNWENTQSTDHFAHSGSVAGKLSPDMEFGLTYKTKNLPELTKKSRTLLFSSFFLKKKLNSCELVITVNADGKNVYYKSYTLSSILKKQDVWEKVDLLFQLPRAEGKDYELGVFLWNTGKDELYLDDFEFRIY